MKKLELGVAVTMLANLAVIAGIVFLVVEMSQNTEAMRLQTVQALQSEFREIFDYPEGFVEAANKDASALTLEEEQIRRTFFSRIMRIYENQWYQYSRGYLDEELFRAYQQHLRITLGNPYNMGLWQRRKELGFFHADFVDYVESFLGQNPPFDINEVR